MTNVTGQYRLSQCWRGLKHYVKSKCSEDEYVKFCGKYHLENIIPVLQFGEANTGELSTCNSMMLLLLLRKK